MRQRLQGFCELHFGVPNHSCGTWHLKYPQHRLGTLQDLVGEIDVRQIAVKIHRCNRQIGRELALRNYGLHTDDDFWEALIEYL